MPRERPRLSEETEEFKVVESWVDDGCPERDRALKLCSPVVIARGVPGSGTG